MNNLTVVVNIRQEPYDVYCGRPGKGQDGVFGNPFDTGPLEDKIAKFKEYFVARIEQDPDFRSKVLSLRGKRLGCFCKPKECHADTIANFLNKTHLAVVGSRDFTDYPKMCEVLDQYDIGMIISGGAKGADSLADRYATEHNIPIVVHKPAWDLHGKAAGHIRNKTIIEQSDEVVAFWDNMSSGTKGSIQWAHKLNKPIQTVTFYRQLPPVDCANRDGINVYPNSRGGPQDMR